MRALLIGWWKILTTRSHGIITEILLKHHVWNCSSKSMTFHPPIILLSRKDLWKNALKIGGCCRLGCSLNRSCRRRTSHLLRAVRGRRSLHWVRWRRHPDPLRPLRGICGWRVLARSVTESKQRSPRRLTPGLQSGRTPGGTRTRDYRLIRPVPKPLGDTTLFVNI